MLFKMWEAVFAAWVYERTLYQGTYVQVDFLQDP